MTETLSYLSVPLNRPKVGFFEFTSCEGCQLQILNNEQNLLDFLNLVEIVNFREIKSKKSDDYEIAFVEGAISRANEVKRLKEIRKKAKVLVAFGSCACFGGVNQLKNRFDDLDWVKKEVYADFPVETREVRPIEAYVAVDLKIYGCPIKKEELERIVTNLVVGKSVAYPEYPVCMECKANENICVFELGEPCLGPITRAGCDAWCTSNRRGCWGCRGPAGVVNMAQFEEIMKKYDFSPEQMFDRLECFGGFACFVEQMKAPVPSRKSGCRRKK